jgi:hypothetical protein
MLLYAYVVRSIFSGAAPSAASSHASAQLAYTHDTAPHVRRFRLATTPEQVGMATGATIHTANGMMMRVARRQAGSGSSSSAAAAV